MAPQFQADRVVARAAQNDVNEQRRLKLRKEIQVALEATAKISPHRHFVIAGSPSALGFKACLILKKM